MSRSFNSYAIILYAQRSQETHKKVLLFAKERGLLWAYAHGALKSKSRFLGSTELYMLLQVQLYHSPIKDSYSIKEIEVVNDFLGIREQGERFIVANCWAELLMKSSLLGETSRVFNLLVHGLKAISQASNFQLPFINLQFLMRYNAYGGIFATINSCLECAKAFDGKNNIFWDSLNGGFICENCLKSSALLIKKEEYRYIKETMSMRFDSALLVPVKDCRILFLIQIFVDLVWQHFGLRLNGYHYYLTHFEGAQSELEKR